MMSESLPLPSVELMELAVGYQRSKTLFAIVDFRIPTLLAGKPLSVEAIARETKLHLRAADRLLNAGVALGLFERSDAGEFANTEMSRTFLVKGDAAYLGEQFKLYDRTSYSAWSDLTKNLREWKPGATDAQTPQDEDQGAESMRAQHNLAMLVGHALAGSLDFSQYKRMLDLGSGSGAMSIAICDVHQELRATLFDLPEVTKVAREFVEASDARARIQIEDGNFKEDSLPEGFDVALLANLLSVSSEETNRELFRRIYDKLPAGGAIILSGWILDNGRTSPLIPVLFCLEDINWGVPDVERSASTYGGWLRNAGFADIERKMFHTPWSFIVGRKPGS